MNTKLRTAARRCAYSLLRIALLFCVCPNAFAHIPHTDSFRSVTVQTRDSLGRVTDQRTTVGGVLALKETVPSWNNLDKVNGVYSERSGAGSWSEYRDYYYDNSARLIYEEFNPSPSSGGDYLLTAYDGPTWGQSATGGIGIRTHTQRGSDAVLLHEVPSVSTFSRVTSENIGGSQPRSVPLSGVALGADKVTLTLDGRDLTPVNFPGWQDATGTWTTAPLVAPGSHRLTATATHPSGWVAPAVTHNFTVLPRAESVTNTYDEMGNVATRTWTGGKVQTLTWDPRGRLLKVVQTGVQPFVWTALYDGLDRRIKTTYTPNGGATVTTLSVFDPEVEFLEIGIAINGAWNWKVYGPDLSGSYGGLQGLGGLEAVIGSDGVTRGVVNDWFGNAVGHVAAPGGAVTWSPAQFLAWGPVPGWGTPPIDGTKPLHELLGYRGLTLDPPGYIQQGLRPYDPQTGRWLSPDPLGHAGSLSLYDYCDNDPLNVFDPDGRFGKSVGSFAYNGGGVGQGLGAISSGFDSLGNYGVNRGNTFIAGLGGGASSLFGLLSAMTTPKTYVNSAIGFANNISTVNSFSGPVAATSYALTSWNVGAVYSGIANVDLVTGGPVGDWADRGARISGGVAATAGIASAGLAGFSAVARPTTQPPVVTSIGYHATHPDIAPIIQQNGFRAGTAPGRLGSGGTYVNNTRAGAIAEFQYHNPGVTPSVLKVEYNPGVNASTTVAPRNYVETLPLYNVDSISAPSLRLPGTTNTNVLNGSLRIVE